jgi:hypothetical protein
MNAPHSVLGGNQLPGAVGKGRRKLEKCISVRYIDRWITFVERLYPSD